MIVLASGLLYYSFLHEWHPSWAGDIAALMEDSIQNPDNI